MGAGIREEQVTTDAFEIIRDSEQRLEEFRTIFGGRFYLTATGGQLCYEYSGKDYLLSRNTTKESFLKDVSDSISQRRNLLLKYPPYTLKKGMIY
jgi:hypothetical protein